MTQALHIPTAEAAFIAGLTDRQMNRVVDEHLVPEPLVFQQGSSRRFTLLGAAFAKFYFATENLLIANARRQILEELTARVVDVKKPDALYALLIKDSISWKVEHQFVSIDLRPFVQDAISRAKDVAQAEALVSTDAEVMGGEPVFAGTRVPLSNVLSSLARDISWDRLVEAYPFLTEAHVEAAKVYEAVHPRKGRPRRLSEVNPELPSRVVRVIKPSERA